MFFSSVLTRDNYLKKSSLLLVLLFCLLSVQTNGQYWERVTNISAPFSNNYWLDIFFLPSNTNYGWVCGFNGYVLRTTDGGTTWRGDSINNAYHLESIHFVSQTIGYTSGVEGIWKTTNGGASWFDITPIQAGDSLYFWGNFFLDADNGVLVGMGCGGAQQHFWRTANGGTTWSYTTGDEFDSGLTDAILFSDGRGLASSSGRIWQSTDYGFTWNVFSTTGTNLWQEEISVLNQSILVPYAGENCQGGGAPNGGMRFSTDNGASWTDRNVGVPIFGTYLLSNTEAWAAGYNRTMLHTTNAGQTWVLKNCGIESGNMDDIWFVSNNNGWVVGQGIYKYAPAKQLITKSNIDFNQTCINDSKYDTLFITSLNFNQISCTINLQGANPESFGIVQPTTNFTVPPCGTTMIIVEFKPVDAGVKSADIRIDVTGYSSHFVNLIGRSVKPSAFPVDTLILEDGLSCGINSIKTIVWQTTDALSDEYIIAAEKTGSDDVSLVTTLPVKINRTGIETRFAINPSDTGWQTARFKFTLFPCDLDTFVTVVFYGESPIITAPIDAESYAECKDESILNIPITNTGNLNLNISNIEVLTPANGFSYIGLRSGFKLPRVLKPNESDTAIVRFASTVPTVMKSKLRISNNDKTTKRGNKAVYDIDLTGSLTFSKIQTNDTIIDLGAICIGDSIARRISIKNTGNLEAVLVSIKNNRNVFKFEPLNSIYPIKISNFDSLLANVKFKPTITGVFRDTFVIKASPCNEEILIIVKGEGISVLADVSPKNIYGTVYNYTTASNNITIYNRGTEPITIQSLLLSPVNPDWSVDVSPPLPQTVESGEELQLTLVFSTQQDSDLVAKLCFELAATCSTDLCLDVLYKSINDPLAFAPPYLNFGQISCLPQPVRQKAMIQNLSSESTRVTDLYIEPAVSDFVLINPPSLPLTIPVGSSVDITVEYTPSGEGTSNAELICKGDVSSIKAELVGEFKTTKLVPDAYDFDFGVFERCEPEIFQVFKFYNQGMLDDTLDIILTTTGSAYTVSAQTLVLPARDSVELIVGFHPNNASNGINDNSVKLNGRVCGDYAEIKLHSEINEPYVEILPNPVEFLNVWPGDTLIRDISLRNSSLSNIEIIQFELNSIDNKYEYEVIMPLQIDASASVVIPIRFIAVKSGHYFDTLKLTYKSVCDYNTSGLIHSNVSNEIYVVRFSIPDYESEPYKEFSFDINLDNAVPKFRPDSLMLELEFDTWLFKPERAYYHSNEGLSEINADLNYGSVRLNVPNEIADTMFLTAGIKFSVEGITFLSSPNRTALAFVETNIITDKLIELYTSDGSLTINPVCHPIGKLRLVLSGEITLSMKNQIVSDGVLSFIINSSKEADASINIYNIDGRIVYHNIHNFAQGRNILNIEPEWIASGSYYFVMNCSTGQVFTGNFILLK